MKNKFYLKFPLVLFLSMVIGISGAFAQNYAQIGYGTSVSPAWTGALMNTYWQDNICQIDYASCDLIAAGLNPGDTINSAGWFILSSYGPMNNANLSYSEGGTTTAVWNDGGSGFTPSFGWNDLSFSSPIVWGGGDVQLEFCFDNTIYSSSNTYQYTSTTGATVNYAYGDNNVGCSMTPNASTADRPNTRFGWSSSGASNVPGCTDPTASNYNASATIDDCSCSWACLQNDITISVSTVSWGGEVSWALINVVTGDTAASGGAMFGLMYSNNMTYTTTVCADSGCYVMEMFDAFGDGWNGGTFTIDDASGTNYASGGLLTGSFESVNVDINGGCVLGCTDPWAPNYNSSAIFDDGSCLYPGCLDPTALNYCTSCNDTDNTLCVYPACDTLDWSTGFEDSTLNNWVTSTAAESHLALSSYTTPLTGSVSLEMSGNTYNGWGGTPYNELAAYDPTKSTHFASAQYCLDFTGSASIVNMTVLCEMPGFYTAPYRWVRVKVNGTVIADAVGNTAYQNSTSASVTGAAGVISTATTLTYDLSAYAGQSGVNIEFESSCKYGPAYNPTYADYVVLDDINVFNVYPCTYYDATVASVTDASCNAGTDGSIDITVNNGWGTDSYSWADASGTVVSTLEDPTGLAAGTYTCTVTDATNGCSATVSATVGEPAAITISALVVDESAPMAGDGAIDISVSGGTPCATSDTVVPGTHASNYTSTFTRGYYFQAQSSYTISGVRCSDDNTPGTGTYQSVEIVDLGANPAVPYPGPGGPHTTLFSAIGDPMGWLPCNVSVVAGNYYGVIGAKHSAAGGTSQTMYNSYGQANPSVIIDGNATTLTRFLLQGSLAAASPASGSYMAEVSGPIGRIEIATGVQGANAYTYAWSTGDTTEDISALGMGPYSVTVTDCNGCQESGSWFVMVNTVLGCTDPAASNYNPLANSDDGSCLYPGCIDPLAVNFDSTANISDTSCIYPCNYYGLQAIQIEVTTNPWPSEVGWCLVNDANGDTVASAGYTFAGNGVGTFDVCMDYGCYTMHMFDSFGDGWNGSTWTATDTNNGSVYGTGGLISGSYGLETFCFDACNSFGITLDASSDVSCNGGSDGSVDITIPAGSTFSWDNGSVTEDLSGLSAGTYTVIVSDTMCSDTLSVTIAEPGVLTASFAVLDATDSTSASGSIDMTVSGGTPCITSMDLLVSLAGGNGQNGNAFNITNTSTSDLTITGFSQGPAFPNAAAFGVAIDVHHVAADYMGYTTGSAGWTLVGSATVDLLANASAGYVPVSGVVIPAGATHGFYITTTNAVNVQYTNGTGTPGVGSWAADANITVSEGHGCVYPFNFAFFPRNWNGTVHYGDPNATAYTFAWSTGDTTEDISVGYGNHCVTITDCNGCVGGPFCATVGVQVIPGCMDPTASNYNPLANINDSSCIPFVYGCTDSSAYNYDPAANTNQASATDSTNPCFYCASPNIVVNFQLNSVAWGSEIGWFIYDASSTVVASGGYVAGNAYSNVAAVYDNYICLPYGCYTIEMWDQWGDGWNGGGYSLIDVATGYVYGTGGLVGFVSYGVDSLCIDPCTQFNISGGAITDASCNGALDGAIDLTVNAPNGVSYAWSNGATTEDVSGLSAGTYTVVISDPNGCIDSASYVIGEPSAITASMVVVDETTPGANDGSIDLSVSGGTPCVTAVSLVGPNLGGNGQSGNAFNIINTSAQAMTITGFSQGSGSGGTSVAVNNTTVHYYPGDYTTNMAGITNTALNGWVFAGAASNSLTAGAATGYVPISVSIPAGATYGFYIENSSTIQYTNGTGTAGVTPWFSDANITVTQGHGCYGQLTTGNWNFAFSPRNFNGNVHYGDPNANEYTFVWTNGDSTEDVSGLTAGSYCVTVTDCNGCTVTACDTVNVNAVYGCTDPNAFNYNPLANIDDSSCIAIAYGCMDSTAANYNAAANTDDGSCHWCFGSLYVNVSCNGGSFQSEVSWELLDSSGTIVLTGGAPFNLDTCLDPGCYTLAMYDSWGDGWNGNVFTLTDNTAGASMTATLGSGLSGSASLQSAAFGCYTYGCTDPLATNYDPSANTDDGSCTYPACYSVGPAVGGSCFDEAWEAGSLTAQDWLISSPGITPVGYQGSYSMLNDSITITGAGSFWATGGDGYSGWTQYSTEAQAFANTTHVQSASVCLDLTGVTATVVMLDLDYLTASGFTNTAPGLSGSAYSTMRVSVDGTVLSDMNGVSWHGEEVVTHLQYDLSAYIGQSVGLTFETACKYNANYNPLYVDEVWIDNISVCAAASIVYGCTDPTALNYNANATNDDGSCTYPCFVAPYSTSFEDGIAQSTMTPDDWTNNLDDNTNSNALYGDWIHKNNGTGSSYTGPNYSTNFGGTGYSMDGTYMMYLETSGNYNNDVSMTSHCFDISAMAAPEFRFWASMYDGSTVTAAGLGGTYAPSMGNLFVYLSGDGGATWDSSHALIGNQGSEWVQSTVDLSAYSASGVTIKLTGITGTTYRSDICVDLAEIVDAQAAVPGCTDSTAVNYNPAATVDDSSCTYCFDNLTTITINTAGWGGEVSWDLTDASGTIVASGPATGSSYASYMTPADQVEACLPNGCYTMNMYDSFGDGWNGGAYDISVGGVSIASGGLATGFSASDEIAIGVSAAQCACTDNWVTLSMTDAFGDGWNGNTWTAAGVSGTSYGPFTLASGSSGDTSWCLADDCYDLVCDFGSWQTEVGWTLTDANGAVLASGGAPYTGQISTGGVVCPVYGCTDPLAANFDSTATVDDSSCVYPCLLDEVTLSLCDSYGDGWNGNSVTVDGTTYTQVGSYAWPYTAGTCETFVLCVDLSTCIDVIYNATGTWGSENSWSVTDANGTVLASGGNSSGEFGVCCVYGCLDPIATNYDSTATCMDSTMCVYCVYGCTDSTQFNYDPLATCDDGTCIPIIYGCTDSTALNYYPAANVDDGTCVFAIYGCTDPTACNYDSTANIDDGSCLTAYGCTDPTACNYDSTATCDDGSCLTAYGCTDPAATNYDPTATCDDGSCILPTSCNDPKPTGVYAYDVIDTRAKIHWDNMNSGTCMVWKYFVRYRPVGTSSWTTKSAGVGNGLCNFGLNTQDKLLLNLLPSTTYEVRMKAFYCGGTESNYSTPVQFTTADVCPPMTNLTVQTFNGNQGKAVFSWDTTGVYVFARVALRVDTSGAAWQTVGGFGTNFPTFSQSKFGLTPGQSYRAQGRTFCNATISAHRSGWTSPIFWAQPGTLIRVEAENMITNLEVYPNPSRDIFNVSFVSDEVQNLEISIINVVGEAVYTADLDQFVGQFTKEVSLATYPKGVYFLEITTDKGVINKKLILQ